VLAAAAAPVAEAEGLLAARPGKIALEQRELVAAAGIANLVERQETAVEEGHPQPKTPVD
jgi:hypothetical protein